MSPGEIHVSQDGSNEHEGSMAAPLRTISAAADRARPGDEVIVHAGTYRERLDPPRGGTEEDRIVYRAAAGDRPVIAGSEVIAGWESVDDGLWRAVIDDGIFDDYNPFAERIRGDWFVDDGRDHHTGSVYFDGDSLREAEDRDALADTGDVDRAWAAEVDGDTTSIWARFGDRYPAEGTVEITVRPAVFYPAEPGIDFLTVRGFRLRHAATQWAPPTTEQIGLIGTHWSRGWIIENNHISHSRCTGITLGKYGTSVDDTGASADRYNDTIRDALEHGWERGSVGHHVVRNNLIHDCEQAGIVGSMGAAFSEVRGNHIHDINRERQFRGAEIAGIKFHGAIDTTIAGNRIHRARRGIWLDWMTQGTRVTWNLLYDNDTNEDLFLEVNHGPFVIDTNVMLSDRAIFDVSQGGAYAHNLIAGAIEQLPELDRETPYHRPRSTAIAGLSRIQGGDDRYLNNVFVGGTGLGVYDDVDQPMDLSGNVFVDGATPSNHEDEPTVVDGSAALEVDEDEESVRLSLTVEEGWATADCELVTTQRLPSAAVPDAPFTEPDGTTLRVETDYLGIDRDRTDPSPGPFASLPTGRSTVDLWPR